MGLVPKAAMAPPSGEHFARMPRRNLAGVGDDLCKNCATMESLSEYELQRLEHMRRNHEELVRLGLADPEPDPPEGRTRRQMYV